VRGCVFDRLAFDHDRGRNHRGNFGAVLVCLVQKAQDFVHGRVFDEQHVFGHVFCEGQKAALGVVPGGVFNFSGFDKRVRVRAKHGR